MHQETHINAGWWFIAMCCVYLHVPIVFIQHYCIAIYTYNHARCNLNEFVVAVVVVVVINLNFFIFFIFGIWFTKLETKHATDCWFWLIFFIDLFEINFRKYNTERLSLNTVIWVTHHWWAFLLLIIWRRPSGCVICYW